MSKYSYEQKLEVAINVVKKHMSHNEVIRKIGASISDSQKWVGLYLEHGAEGLRMRHGSYDGQFKIEVVEYMHKHKLSIRHTAAKFGIPSYTTVGEWKRIYYEEGSRALLSNNRGRKKTMSKSKPNKITLKNKTEDELKVENKRLRTENAYLKKLNALVQERIQRETEKKL